MEDFYFITGNDNKYKEVCEILGKKIKRIEIDLEEIQSDDSYKIAKKKVLEAYRILKKPVVIEDISFYIDAFNGFPGPLIKFLVSSNGTQGIYNIMKGQKNKKAVSRCVVAHFDGKNLNFFTGDVKGKIVAPKGKSKFGFDPIFQPEGKQETLAEMGKDEKNKISHRSLAWKKFGEF
ncbi:MAG: RdgB/HAM1 family non-canonical purine NTP pyrophosphatase, partial [Candidatus Pacearchaeota archaeon]|nr:RdgB/HAM1 family non-canonical purine NTP pyrophosphatase [Candidatus Pacearchaeota archaeon]